VKGGEKAREKGRKVGIKMWCPSLYRCCISRASHKTPSWIAERSKQMKTHCIRPSDKLVLKRAGWRTVALLALS